MRALGAGIILFGDDFDTAKTEVKRVAKENNFVLRKTVMM